MSEYSNMLNIIGGSKKNNVAHHAKQASHHLSKLAGHISHISNHTSNNTTSNLANDTIHLSIFGKIYSVILEIGKEYFIGLIAIVLIFLSKMIIYDYHNSDVDISNVVNPLEANDEYNTSLVKQRKLLNYIKDKFKWAELISSTNIALMSILVNMIIEDLINHTIINYNYILILVFLFMAWYSGFLEIIYDFIVEVMNDKNDHINSK